MTETTDNVPTNYENEIWGRIFEEVDSDYYHLSVAKKGQVGMICH